MSNCTEAGFAGLRERGDMFSNDSQEWKHKVRLIRAFIWGFCGLSLMVLKVLFILSVMILKSKANHLSPYGFLCHWSLLEFICPQRNAMCMACCNASSHG